VGKTPAVWQGPFLDRDHLTDGPRRWREVARLLFHPHLVGRFPDFPELTTANRLLFTVSRELCRQLSTPPVEFIVRQIVPHGTRTETPDFLLAVADEPNQLVPRWNEWCGVHYGEQSTGIAKICPEVFSTFCKKKAPQNEEPLGVFPRGFVISYKLLYDWKLLS